MKFLNLNFKLCGYLGVMACCSAVSLLFLTEIASAGNGRVFTNRARYQQRQVLRSSAPLRSFQQKMNVNRMGSNPFLKRIRAYDKQWDRYLAQRERWEYQNQRREQRYREKQRKNREKNRLKLARLRLKAAGGKKSRGSSFGFSSFRADDRRVDQLSNAVPSGQRQSSQKGVTSDSGKTERERGGVRRPSFMERLKQAIFG